MSQKGKELVALPEDQNSLPSTHMMMYNLLTPQF